MRQLISEPSGGRRSSSPGRKLACILVGLFLGVIFLVFALYRSSAPVIVRVGFLGYTNGLAGRRLASFGFTNQSRVTIRRWGHFDREVKKSRLLNYTSTFGRDVLLAPGQGEVIVVPVDAEPAFSYQKDWRAVFYWRREDGRVRFQIWADNSVWVPPIFQGRPIRVQPAPSEWLDP